MIIMTAVATVVFIVTTHPFTISVRNAVTENDTTPFPCRVHVTLLLTLYKLIPIRPHT
jgi:hypothetical protein